MFFGYDSGERKLFGSESEYEIYTGKTLDERIMSIVLFAEGKKTLQEVYTDLLLYDANKVNNIVIRTSKDDVCILNNSIFMSKESTR